MSICNEHLSKKLNDGLIANGSRKSLYMILDHFKFFIPIIRADDQALKKWLERPSIK